MTVVETKDFNGLIDQYVNYKYKKLVEVSRNHDYTKGNFY